MRMTDLALRWGSFPFLEAPSSAPFRIEAADALESMLVLTLRFYDDRSGCFEARTYVQEIPLEYEEWIQQLFALAGIEITCSDEVDRCAELVNVTGCARYTRGRGRRVFRGLEPWTPPAVAA